MRIRLRVFASFREVMGRSELSIDAPEGASVADLLERLGAQYPRLGPTLTNAMLAVNQEYVGPDYRLREGDELALIPPVSGGGVPLLLSS
jgi:molybdopterin converting factor subunit 1